MTFDPNDTRQLDMLFSMTQRGPFSGYSPDQIAGEQNAIAALPASIAEDAGWPLYLQGYVFSRCYNENFTAQPPGGNGSTLNNLTNKLPGWKVVDTTSDASSAIVYTLNSYDVGLLTLKMNETAQVGDRVYIEQTVYMPSVGPRLHSIKAGGQMFDITYSSTDFDMFIEVEWSYPDGTVTYTDTAHYYPSTGNPIGYPRLWFNDRGPGGYATIRIGVECLSTANLSGNGLVSIALMYESTFDTPDIYDHSIRFSYGNATAHETLATSTTYNMDTEQTDVHETVGGYTAMTQGLFTGISVRTDSTFTAGNIEFRPQVAGSDVLPISGWLGYNVDGGASTYKTWMVEGREFIAVSDFDFWRGDRLGMNIVTNGTWNGTAGCYLVTLHLALVMHNGSNGTGNYRSFGHDYGLV